MTDAATHAGADAAAEAAELVALGAEIGWTSTDAATALRADYPSGHGRLGELAEWLAATSTAGTVGTLEPLGRTRLVVAGEIAPHVAELADASDAGIRELPAAAGAAIVPAVQAGIAAADAEVESGTKLLVVACPDPPVDAPVADRAAAAALTGALSGAEPVALLPRGRWATDTRSWIAQAEFLRDARRRLLAVRARPERLLAEIGDVRLATLVGVILRATVRRTPLVLDGAAPLAAALLCRDIQPRAVRWWRAADTSPDRVHLRCCEELGMTPVLGLGTSAGNGTAGLLCLPLLRAAAELGRRR